MKHDSAVSSTWEKLRRQRTLVIKQRAAVMRDLLGLTRHLLGLPGRLIDAMSVLNPANETSVYHTMAGLRGATAMLVISHRTSMQEDADQVVEVCGGAAVGGLALFDDDAGRDRLRVTSGLVLRRRDVQWRRCSR